MRLMRVMGLMSNGTEAVPSPFPKKTAPREL